MSMSKVLFTLGVLLWIAGVAAGFVVLERYSLAEGMASEGVDWPAGTAVQPSAERPTLLMFAHPHCPCTHSSLEELNREIARQPQAADYVVVFTIPQEAGAEWRDSTLYRLASASQGVRVVLDEGGVEAQRFGAHTSGTVLLYNTHGKLMFDGGITAARGHEGDNDGLNQLDHVLREGTGQVLRFPVFGCGLINAGDTPEGATP